MYIVPHMGLLCYYCMICMYILRTCRGAFPRNVAMAGCKRFEIGVMPPKQALVTFCLLANCLLACFNN